MRKTILKNRAHVHVQLYILLQYIFFYFTVIFLQFHSLLLEQLFRTKTHSLFSLQKMIFDTIFGLLIHFYSLI